MTIGAGGNGPSCSRRAAVYINCGWSEAKKPYYTLSIKRLGFNANLGRYPGQDDPTLQAIIEWDPRD
ncbi:hypothetical protein NKH74_27640 [Mesorhizobium sp. M0933]|uniref:hypothetical protein n=1 Tax=Mesorhizobium sp. M0933 TaxID=2957030 RepID=UPI0033361927